MKNSQFYRNDKNEKVEIWHEEIGKYTDYWMKVNGVSYPLTKRKYLNRIKKYELTNTLQ